MLNVVADLDMIVAYLAAIDLDFYSLPVKLSDLVKERGHGSEHGMLRGRVNGQLSRKAWIVLESVDAFSTVP